jgi:hypothetical protein
MIEQEHGSSLCKRMAEIDVELDEACRRFNAGCGYMMIVGGLSLVGSIEDQQAAVGGLRRLLCNMISKEDVSALFEHLPILATDADTWVGLNLIVRGFVLMTGSDAQIVAGELFKFLVAAHQTHCCEGRHAAITD